MSTYIISSFKNVKNNKPFDIYLEKWLNYTINPPKEWLRLYEKYQETLNENDKKNLPAVTISARFKGRRDEKHLLQKLPFICLDIDRYSKNNKKPSNDCIDMQLVKKFFMSHPSCYFCGYSCSGDGIYAVMYIFDPDRLLDYFQYFKEKLSKRGLNIDESCKDYARLRFFSVDTEAYINPDAKPLKIPITKKPMTKPKKIRKTSNYSGDVEQKKTEKIISIIERNSLDITSVYDDWIKIAGALNNQFGEATGRQYFHQISQYHSDYDYEKCDKKFDHCRKMNKTSIASLYKIAGDYGVRYKS